MKFWRLRRVREVLCSEEVLKQIQELNVEVTCGIISLLRKVGFRYGIQIEQNQDDIAIYVSDYDKAKDITYKLNLRVYKVVLPRFSQRVIWVSGLPHISFEDFLISIIENLNDEIYVKLAREIARRILIDWSWVKIMSLRLGIFDKLLEILELEKL